MLAVVAACERVHSYLCGTRFVVDSDHKPLEVIHLKNLTAAPPRLQRMLLLIQGYDLTVLYKPGAEMHLTDPLSRLNPLPSEGSLDLQAVCLVRFSAAKRTFLSKTRNPTLNSQPCGKSSTLVGQRNRNRFQPN